MRLAIGFLAALALAPAAAAQDVRELDVREDGFAEAADDTALQLSNILGRLSNQAGNVAYQAQSSGNPTRARRFQDLSSRAGILATEIDNRVVSALNWGDRARARQQLQTLDQHFSYLDYSYRNIGQAPVNVQQNYQRVVTLRQTLQNQLRGGGGGGFWQCTAVDSGWEEHRGGHRADGQSYQQALQRALGLCQRAHGNCVINSCVQGRD